MEKFTIFFLFFVSSFFGTSLHALRIDPNASSFAQREKKKVEVYDFTGDYPKLEDVDIDARKKINVELLLSGNYPLLKKINFEGGFGAVSGAITGTFPLLETVDIVCTDSLLSLNLDAKWEKECTINIAGTGDIVLNLPKDIGLLVTIKTATPFEKIYVNHPSLFKRKGILMQKIFLNPIAEGETRPIKINIISAKGTITLN